MVRSIVSSKESWGLWGSLGEECFKKETKALRSDVSGTREDAHDVGEEEVREGL